MKKGNDTKMRILAVEKMFRTKKRLTVKGIILDLKVEYGIDSERKAIYDDIAVITRFLPVCVERINKQTFYFMI